MLATWPSPSYKTSTAVQRQPTQIYAGQVVLLGDLLGAEVLLHRHRVVRASLHRGVVGHNHALHPVRRKRAAQADAT